MQSQVSEGVKTNKPFKFLMFHDVKEANKQQCWAVSVCSGIKSSSATASWAIA